MEDQIRTQLKVDRLTEALEQLSTEELRLVEQRLDLPRGESGNFSRFSVSLDVFLRYRFTQWLDALSPERRAAQGELFNGRYAEENGVFDAEHEAILAIADEDLRFLVEHGFIYKKAFEGGLCYLVPQELSELYLEHEAQESGYRPKQEALALLSTCVSLYGCFPLELWHRTYRQLVQQGWLKGAQDLLQSPEAFKTLLVDMLWLLPRIDHEQDLIFYAPLRRFDAYLRVQEETDGGPYALPSEQDLKGRVYTLYDAHSTEVTQLKKALLALFSDLSETRIEQALESMVLRAQIEDFDLAFLDLLQEIMGPGLFSLRLQRGRGKREGASRRLNAKEKQLLLAAEAFSASLPRWKRRGRSFKEQLMMITRRR